MTVKKILNKLGLSNSERREKEQREQDARIAQRLSDEKRKRLDQKTRAEHLAHAKRVSPIINAGPKKSNSRGQSRGRKR